MSGPLVPIVEPARGLLSEADLSDSRKLGAVKVHLEAVAAKVEKLLEVFGDRPQFLPTDPRVAALAFRFPSQTERGRTYDVAIRAEAAVSCECWPSLAGRQCPHVLGVLDLHRSESRLAEVLLELRSAVTLARTAARAGEPEPIKRVCSGCGKHLDGPSDAAKTSHGMCSLSCWNIAAEKKSRERAAG